MLASSFLLVLLVPAALIDPFFASSPADERPVGRLEKLHADGSAELATANGPVVVRDLVSLRRSTTTLPPLPRGPLLITTNGDRLPGSLVGGDDRSLHFRPSFTESEWEVPLDSVSVIWLTKPPAETPCDPERYSWLPANRNRDILRFRNGDVASGTLEGFTPGKPTLRFKPETGEVRDLPFAEVSAIAFNPTLARSRKPKGPYARLVLSDGTRLAVTMATADTETLKGKTLFGSSVELPIANLVSLDVVQGKAIYLSDLKPKRVEQAGFLGAGWSFTANRNVRGEPLRILTAEGVNTFDRGIGTHPKTTLTYDLGGKYRRFEAVVGLDASCDRGRAAVRILVDRKERVLPELQKLTAGPATAVRIDIVGAKELTLIVDFGLAGDVQADVNWGDARLVE